MDSSVGGRGASHVLLVGITRAAEARVKKSCGDGIQIASLFAERCYGSLKIESDDGAKQSRALEKLLHPGVRTSQLLIVVLPFAKTQREVDSRISGLSRGGAKVLVLKRGANGLPESLRSIDQKVHDAMAVAVLDALRSCGLGSPLPQAEPVKPVNAREKLKQKLLQGLASHRKWGEYNHSSEDDFWSSRGKNLSSSERREIADELISAGLIGTKVNDGDNGKGLRYFLRPENKGLLVRLFPQLLPYT